MLFEELLTADFILIRLKIRKEKSKCDDSVRFVRFIYSSVCGMFSRPVAV